MPSSRLRRAAAVVAATVALVFVLPGAATAATPGDLRDPFGCKTAPVAESPTDGLPGWVLSAPRNPPTEVDGSSGASLLQNYGVAGLSWFTFDDDCDLGAGAVTEAPSSTTDAVASAAFLPAVLAAAVTASAGNAFGNPDWLDFLNPAMEQVTTALSEAFTAPLMPLFVLVTAVVALLFASTGQVSRVLRSLAFVLVGLAVVALTVGWPVAAGTVVDNTVSGVVVGVQDRVVPTDTTPADREQPGSALVGNLYKPLVWDTWLRGQLGSDDSAVAQRHGYALYAARTLTYAQKAAVDRDPGGAGKKVYEEKAAAFKAVADRIKAEDPGAYQVLTSSNFGQRFGLAIGSWLVAAAAFSIPFLAFVLLLLCFLYWRFTIILGPALGAVMAMMPAVARSVARKLGAVVLNTIVFGTGAAVYIALARFILEASLPFAWQVLGLAVLTVAGWLILHPIRALTKFTQINTPGYDGVPGGGAMRKGARWGAQYLVTRKAVDDAEDDEDDEDAEERRAGGWQPATAAPRGRRTHQWDDPGDDGLSATRRTGPGTSASPVVVDAPSVHYVPVPRRGRDDDIIDAEIVEDTALPTRPTVRLLPAVPDSVPADELPDPARLGVALEPAGRYEHPSRDAEDRAGWVYYDAATKTFTAPGRLRGIESPDRP
ncbi:MAG: hypothetical protein ACRCYX_03905 [Dermatophilaceae bacterium]